MTEVAGLFDRMRRGDHDALGELLAAEGVSIERLAESLVASPVLSDVIRCLWRASVVAPRNVDPRAYAWSVVAEYALASTHVVPKEEADPSQPTEGERKAPSGLHVDLGREMDRASLVHLAARVAAQIADATETRRLEEICRTQPQVQILSTMLRSAVELAATQPPGVSEALEEAWKRVRAELH